MIEKIKTFFRVNASTPQRWWRELMKKWRRILSKLDSRTRTVYWILAVIFAIVIPIVSGYAYMFGKFIDGKYTWGTALGQSVFRYLAIGMTYGLGWTLLAYIILGIFFIVMIIGRTDELSIIDYVDEETQTAYAKKEFAIYGNKRWADEEEIGRCFELGPVEDATGIIVGAIDKEGKKVISIPVDAKMGNLNTMVIGAPGSGKSACFAQNAIMQAQKRQESLVVIDTKGELATRHYRSLENDGYKVWLYNVKDPKKSHAWNFCNEVFNPKTWELEDSRLDMVVSTIMDNTVIGQKEDPFFRSGTVTVLKSILAYFAYCHEQALAMTLEKRADQLEKENQFPNLSEERKIYLLMRVRNSLAEELTLKERFDALRELVEGTGKLDEEMVDQYMKDVRQCDKSEPITIEKVVEFLVKYTLSEMTDKITRRGIPATHPAYTAWQIANKGGENITPSFITGLANRLSLFLSQDIAAMCAYDDIDIRDIGKTKTALFVVVSDNDSSKKALTSLFFTFLFRDLADAADEEGTENRIPVNVIEDEFPNIGRVVDFERTIATSRSRKIYLFIIIQSLSQLRKVYSEDDMNIILECANTTICLGLNGSEDNITAKYIQSICGQTTRVSRETNDRKNIFGLREDPTGGFGTRQSVQRTYLITEDELMDMNKDLLIVKSSICTNPLKVKKFLWTKHPTAWTIDGTPLPDYVDFSRIKQPRPNKLFPPSEWPATQDLYGKHRNLLENVNTKTVSEVNKESYREGNILKRADKNKKEVTVKQLSSVQEAKRKKAEQEQYEEESFSLNNIVLADQDAEEIPPPQEPEEEFFIPDIPEQEPEIPPEEGVIIPEPVIPAPQEEPFIPGDMFDEPQPEKEEDPPARDTQKSQQPPVNKEDKPASEDKKKKKKSSNYNRTVSRSTDPWLEYYSDLTDGNPNKK